MDHNLEKPNKVWKEIRLFISSTFRDMHAERDFLVRFVFPKIREELLKRRIYFVDVDLRWGITAEDNIVGACRSIIDECKPLFLGILGDRYGWTPEQSENSISVTEDEIEYAIKISDEDRYQRLYFLFRDEETTLSMREAIPGEFRELPGSKQAQKLAELKKRIKDAGYKVETYKAVWDDQSKSLTNLNNFGELVYNYIYSYIEEVFGPESFANPSTVEEDDALSDLFISQQSRFFITEGLEASIEKINQLALCNFTNNLILISGQRGIGKTSFLCNFIERLRTSNEVRVIPHFVGVTARSSDLDGTLRRLCQLLARESIIRETLPYELDRLILYFQRLLVSLPKDRHYILVIDALNQLQPTNGAHELRWLPQSIPANVTIILSSTPHPIVETIRARWPQLQEIELKGLNKDASRVIIDHFLSRYQKHLSESQINCLIDKKGAHIPLYLITILDELRIFGYYEGLVEFIESLPHDTVNLIEWIVNTRIANAKEFIDSSGVCISEFLVRRYLSYIYISQTGLSEIELAELLDKDTVYGNTAALTRQLRNFLTLQGEFLTFYHDDIRTAVYNSFIQGENLSRFHEELALYFNNQADPDGNNSWKSETVRHFQQLLYHRLHAGDRQAMVSLIDSLFFEAYVKIGTLVLLMRELQAVATFLAEDTEVEHWEAMLRCARIFSDIAKSLNLTNFYEPHILEYAIAEGRDDDVATIMAASEHGTQAAVLRCSAHTLYSAMGRYEKAQDFENSYPESLDKKNCSLPTMVIYAAINNSGTKNEEDISGEKPNDQTNANNLEQEYTDKNIKKLKPRLTIPLWQLFSLNAMGEYSFAYGLSVGLITFLGALYLAAPLYDQLDNIKLMTAAHPVLKFISVKVATLVFGIPVIGSVYLINRILYRVFVKALSRHAKAQMLSMLSGINDLSIDKQLIPLMNLIRYTRLLRQAKIDEKHWDYQTAANFLSNAVSLYAKLGQTENAGLLTACIINCGKTYRIFLSKSITGLSSDIINEVMYNMLKYKKIVLYSKELFDFVLVDIYQYAPPAPILLEILSVQKRDDERHINAKLQQVNRSLLTSCILRSLMIKTQLRWYDLLNKHIDYYQRSRSMREWIFRWRKAINKHDFVVEPIRYSFLELLINAPLLPLFLLAYCFAFYLEPIAKC
ncbi:MAG: NACHT domain protein [Pelotomaculum sp. PtaU1.Bin035]|nr:MAG: NACHT domain protein [Pelotomaculum sp. PtaU1.Bin035]